MSGVGIDEASHRRPDWAEGEAIVLGNGQPWHFVRPVLNAFYFARGADGKTRISSGFHFGEPYERLVDAYVEADDVASEVIALFDLAFDLLARNYDVTHDTARLLLRRFPVGSPHHEANLAMWVAIRDVAIGQSPKGSAVG